MLAKVQSCAVVGLDAEPIHVEVDIASGLERITISRASGSLTFPASFVLVGALNPCPQSYMLHVIHYRHSGLERYALPEKLSIDLAHRT